LLTATNQWISLIAVIATPIHPASYTTLMTIPAAEPAAAVRTPIVTVPPIPIGTAIAVVTIRTMIAVAVRTIAMTVIAVSAAAVISTAICASLNSAMDARNAAGC
jgi:hypothetical protein